jgi:hypothetical protein
VNVTIAWNVWNNYEDVLLGSEIFSLENERLRVFEEVSLIAQGGFVNPPNIEEKTYLSDYLHIDIDESLPIVQKHVKYKGAIRIINGIKRAYQYGLDKDSDFVVITNADAWFLDLKKLRSILELNDVCKAAISARVGGCVAMYLNYGDFVPFFDDHFIILNVKKCNEHKVFEYSKPNVYKSSLIEYGGIHYMLTALMDEIVPDGLFNIYSMVVDGLNHYNEKSGYSLLPWQYQPSTGFLHANCAQEPFLHNLRAYQLEVLSFSKYPNIKKYLMKYNDRKNMKLCRNNLNVYYRKGLKEKFTYLIIIILQIIKFVFYRNIIHRKFINHYSKQSRGCLHFFKMHLHVLPFSFVSRRPQ